MKRWIWLGMILLLSACASGGGNDATPTPLRPLVREAIHVENQAGKLQVTLNEITLLDATPPMDTQIFAVLADGVGESSYLLFPSNQAGVPETMLTLAEYPLQLEPLNGEAYLWLVALKHHAYDISEEQATIAEKLALAFSQLAATQPTLADLVALQPDLLPWFGEIEVLGELQTSFRAAENWSADETLTSNTLSLQLSVTYAPPSLVSLAPSPQAITITPTPSAIPPNFTSQMGQALEGYKLVVSEDFANASSTVKWFIGSDPTYSASLVNGAYQIALLGIDPNREVGLSWGSIQGLYFDDYVIRARMRVLQPDVIARYGLWLHYQDDFNFVFFGVENTGRYRVARFRRVYEELVPWTSSPLVFSGDTSNELEISLQQERYSLKINGQTLASTEDRAFFSGRIAFFCYSETVPATCQLEAIEIWIPNNYGYPRPTTTPRP